LSVKSLKWEKNAKEREEEESSEFESQERRGFHPTVIPILLHKLYNFTISGRKMQMIRSNQKGRASHTVMRRNQSRLVKKELVDSNQLGRRGRRSASRLKIPEDIIPHERTR